MATRKKLDWEAIEREFRAGVLSIREIGAKHGCSDTAIRKRAKKDGWKRSLADKVRQRVREKMVRSEVCEPSASDEEVIEAAANRGFEVQQIHRRDIREAQVVLSSLTKQLAEYIENRDDIESQIEDETKDDSGTKRRNRMLKAVSLPSHAGVLRDLSVALKNLIPLERQAFSLDDEGGGISIDELLGLITKKNPQVASRVVEMLRDE